MRTRLVIALLVLVPLGCAPAKMDGAAGDRAAAAGAKAAALMPVSAVLVDRPGLLVVRLENGMDVILAERHAAPVCTVQAWVRCGSTTEEALAGCGVSHFVEHMLFKGTARRKAREMDRDISMAGGDDNAYTSLDRTVYHITIPSRKFDVALDCVADAIQHAAFDPAETRRERQVIAKEINLGEDDPGRIFGQYVSQTLYQVAPERHPVIGYRPLFETVSHEQLVGYYRRMYVPNNMFFLAAGDFDAGEALLKIQRAFAGFERRPFAQPRIPEEPGQAAPRELRLRDGHFRDSRLCVAWPSVTIADPDMYALDMGAMLLGAGPTSRLHRRLVEQDKLAFGVEAGNNTPARPGHFEIYADLDEQNLDKALAAIEEEVARLVAGPIDPADMARTLAKHRADEVFARETVDGLASSLGQDYLLTGDADFSAKYLDRLATVKPAEVSAALKKYLVPARRTTVTVMPPKEPEGAPAGAVRAPRKSPEAGRPKIERVELPGGGRLLLLERHDAPIVAISAVFLGGVRFEPAGKNGVSDLMAAMLTRGTAKHSVEQMAEALEACGGALSGYGGRNSFGVSGRFLAGDLGLGLGLVNEVLAAPTFADDEFGKFRERVLAGIRRRAEDIDQVHDLLLEKAIYGAHPYALPAAGTEETVKALSRRDLVDFHARFCRPDNMVLCIAGDFKAEEARKLVLANMADFLKPRAEKLRLPPVPETPRIAAPVRQTQTMPDAKQAMLSLAFRGVDNHDPDRFAIDGLSAVLSGMAGRLFIDLRDRRSLAYSVGAYAESGLDPGAFVFYIATEADKLDDSLQGIWRHVEKIRKEPVSAEELERARNSIIGADAARQQTNGFVAQSLAYNELYGMGAEATFAYIKEVQKLTAADIQRVAAKYLTNGRYVLVITRPAPEAKPNQ